MIDNCYCYAASGFVCRNCHDHQRNLACAAAFDAGMREAERDEWALDCMEACVEVARLRAQVTKLRCAIEDALELADHPGFRLWERGLIVVLAETEPKP